VIATPGVLLLLGVPGDSSYVSVVQAGRLDSAPGMCPGDLAAPVPGSRTAVPGSSVAHELMNVCWCAMVWDLGPEGFRQPRGCGFCCRRFCTLAAADRSLA
jgi:hypothetical protein